MLKTKLAFVGPERIHASFKEFDDSWDMQVPLESLTDLERELSRDEAEAGISRDTSVVIFFSRLFSEDRERFASWVAYSAPYSVACVLIPEGDKALYQDEIERAVREAQLREASEDDSYNSNAPFFFVTYEYAQDEIFDAVKGFCSSAVVDEGAKSAVRVMLPDGGSFGEYSDFVDELPADEGVVELPDKPEGAKGLVFTVTSSKGGSGKSTVSIALGAYLSSASKDGVAKGLLDKPLRVCLVDLDNRDGQHWILMGARKPATVMDIVAYGEPTVDVIPHGVWHSDKIDCDFVFAPKRPRYAKEIPASFYAKLIQNLRALYDVIILDTSTNYLDPLAEEVAYPLSDRIVFVSDMGRSSILGCTRWIAEEMEYDDLGDRRIPKGKVGVVINKAMVDVNMSSEKIERAIRGLPILSMIPSKPKLVIYAANTSELHQILNDRLINEAIKNVAEALLPDVSLGTVPYRR